MLATPGAHAVRSASVGDRRAARSAGSSPAIAPITSAAPSPPAHAERRDDDRPALRRARRSPVASAPSSDARRAAEQREQDRLGRGTGRGSAPRVAPSARRRPISERRSSTEMTMMFATPTAPTSSATAPRPRNRPVERALRRRRAPSSASDGWLTSTSRVLGVGGRGEHATAPPRPGRVVRAHVDRRSGWPSNAEVRFAAREADERPRGRSRARAPPAAGSRRRRTTGPPSHTRWPGNTRSMPSRARPPRAEHGDRLARGRGVQVAALRDGRCRRRAAGRGSPPGRCRPLVSTDGISGLRYTARRQRRCRRHPLDLGRCGRSSPAPTPAAPPSRPNRLSPFSTVSRFVPRRSISASSPPGSTPRGRAPRPSRATPIAIPSADSAARSRRVRRPTLATRARSAGRSRHRRRDRSRRPPVRHDPPVQHLDPARQLGRELGVVGDRPRPSRRRDGGRCSSSRIATPAALSRLPVGSSASTIAGRPTSARAIATRWRSPPESFGGRNVARCESPTRSSASAARARRSGAATPP